MSSTSLLPEPTEPIFRILCWNIEFLGTREPPQTPEQIDAIAKRILTFNAAVLALQEISVKSVLEGIRNKLGVSWRIYRSGDSENTLLYDGNNVDLFGMALTEGCMWMESRQPKILRTA